MNSMIQFEKDKIFCKASHYCKMQNQTPVKWKVQKNVSSLSHQVALKQKKLNSQKYHEMWNFTFLVEDIGSFCDQHTILLSTKRIEFIHVLND